MLWFPLRSKRTKQIRDFAFEFSGDIDIKKGIPFAEANWKPILCCKGTKIS